MLQEGRKCEAITAGRRCLQTMDTSASINALRSQRTCDNCGLSHQPKRCPAYQDTCKSCGSKGHWAKCCRKSREKNKGRRNESPHTSLDATPRKTTSPDNGDLRVVSTLRMTQRMSKGRSILQITPKKRKKGKLRQYSMESQCLTSA